MGTVNRSLTDVIESILDYGDNKPFIVVLCGVPASGKSTFCEKMLNTTSTEVVWLSRDNIIESRAKDFGLTYNDIYHEYADTAEDIFGKIFREALQSKESIVYDRVNHNTKYRNMVLNAVDTEVYNIFAVHLDIPLETAIERSNKRNEETGKEINEFIIADFWHTFEKPTKSEGFTEVFTITT